MARINKDDRQQFPGVSNALKVELKFNAADELIWIVYTSDFGKEYRQQVEDDAYSGGTAYGTVARVRTYNSWVKQ